jgi:hypothetical protein
VGDVATRGGGGATQRHSLSTCHPDGAPVLLEEDAATVTKLLSVRLITLPVLFVGSQRERVPFIKKVTSQAPTRTINAEAG